MSNMNIDFRDVVLVTYILWAGFVTGYLMGPETLDFALGFFIGGIGPASIVSLVWFAWKRRSLGV